MITLTEKAAKEVQRIIADQKLPENTKLRVICASGGCSGFSYKLEFTESYDEAKDEIFEHHDVQVVIDKKSDLYLNGTSIDYYTGLEARGFVFNNPLAKNSCGCGKSFSV